MAGPVTLSPLNDFVLSLKPKDIPAASLKAAMLTAGTISGYLTTSPTATVAVDPSLVATITYLADEGAWKVSIDAAILTDALLETHFAAAAPYLILVYVGGFRRNVPLTYQRSVEATVV